MSTIKGGSIGKDAHLHLQIRPSHYRWEERVSLELILLKRGVRREFWVYTHKLVGVLRKNSRKEVPEVKYNLRDEILEGRRWLKLKKEEEPPTQLKGQRHRKIV